MDIIIETLGLTKIHRTKEIETIAVNSIDLRVERGEYLIVSGPSGGGKSTLMALLGLLDAPTSGSYRFLNDDVLAMGERERCRIRNEHIGFVFQSFNLIEKMTALENVRLPLINRPTVSISTANELAKEALALVGMTHRINHYPTQLSGGQQQRVAIARAIVTKPKILFADEPTGNLDSHSANEVLELLKEQHENGTTIVMVTHDPRHMVGATRKINILDGQVSG